MEEAFIKKLVLFLLVVSVTLLSGTNLFALSESEPGYEFSLNSTVSVNDVDEQVQNQSASTGRITISSNNEITLSSIPGQVNLKSTDAATIQSLTLTGELYSFRSGYKKDKVILGDYVSKDSSYSVKKSPFKLVQTRIN